jgi:hypothetical protein
VSASAVTLSTGGGAPSGTRGVMLASSHRYAQRFENTLPFGHGLRACPAPQRVTRGLFGAYSERTAPALSGGRRGGVHTAHCRSSSTSARAERS